MALVDLASPTDLSARGIAASAVHATMLKVASATVRGAAGSPISQTDSTIVLTAWGEQILDLPGRPVTEVDEVTVDGSVVDDWRLCNTAGLWRRAGWGDVDCPAQVEVTMTHGLPIVPADIVQLVCDLAILGANAAPTGAHDPRVFSESIDDYAVTYNAAGASVASAMELPPLTRASLAARFGGGVIVTRNRA